MIFECMFTYQSFRSTHCVAICGPIVYSRLRLQKLVIWYSVHPFVKYILYRHCGTQVVLKILERIRLQTLYLYTSIIIL